MNLSLRFSVAVFVLAIVTMLPVQNQKEARPAQSEVTRMTPQTLLKKLIGKWEGKCKTWFQPGKLADESELTGEFVDVFDGKFVRHRYQGSIQERPRNGEEMITFNSITELYQSSWVDDFHMNYAIMFSEGEATEQGFSIKGEYDVGKGQPKWSWRTEYKLVDDDNLTITSYNILPTGEEAKAVEIRYRRTK